MLPFWLARHLEHTGAITPDGVSRAARPRRCPRCGTMTLRGLDEDRCAFDISVDIDPTTQIGEVIALSQGQQTYYLLREANSRGRRIWTINRRELHHLAANNEAVIMVGHRCGTKLPKDLSRNSEQTPTNHDHPPF